MKKIKFVMSEVPVSVGWDQVGVSVFTLEIHVKDVDGEYISKLDPFPTQEKALEWVSGLTSIFSQAGYTIE